MALSPIIAALAAALLIYCLIRFMLSRPVNYPPGPPRLPIFGSYPLLLLTNFRHMHLATAALARWYRTDVLGFFYGDYRVVTVHNLKLTREVLLNTDLDGRAVFELVRLREPDWRSLGIFFTGGDLWREQRRFTLRHLRDFGFGRRFAELEMHTNEALLDFVDMVRNGPKYPHERGILKDGVLELPVGLMALPTNMFLKCVLNERMERSELGVLFEMARQGLRFQRTACVFGRFFSLMPSWKYLFPKATGFTVCRSSSMALHRIVRTMVEREWATFDAAYERHFLDIYFKEMEAEKADTTFEINQLTMVILDFMFPPLVAVPTALCLALNRLLMHPECIRRLQQEVDTVVGQGRLPTLDDRQLMPYTEATLRESMRLDTLVPVNMAHMATADTTIGEYHIPKETMVITILESVHRDEREFDDALAFRPERLLEPRSGKVDLSADKSVPFGLGKRLCAGETFARNMMFLVLATIVQNFEWSYPEGERPQHPDRPTIASGITKSVPNYRLKFTSR